MTPPTTSRTQTPPGGPAHQTPAQRRRTVRLFVAGIAIAVALGVIGAWGVVRGQNLPDSPLQQHKQGQMHRDPFGF